MAYFGFTKTSPSDSSAISDDIQQDVQALSPEQLKDEVMGSFGHTQAPLPAYKIPRKEVNSTIIYTSTDPRARQLSIAPSFSNGARSSIQWSNPHTNVPEVEDHDQDRPSSLSPSQYYAYSPVSPRDGMGISLENALKMSGLGIGRNGGSKKSIGSSVEVAMGDVSRSASTRAARQMFVRKESLVDRGLRGCGLEYRVADSSCPPIPEGHASREVGSPINAITISPRKSSIQDEGTLTPPEEQYVGQFEGARPLFSPRFRQGEGASRNSPKPPHHSQSTFRGMGVPEHTVPSPYHERSPVVEIHGGESPSTGAVGRMSGKDGGWDNDVENPRNWNMKRKCFSTLIAVLYTFAIIFTSSVYIPANSTIAAHFGVTPTAANVGFFIFTLGLVFGPILGVTFSDLHGRKPIYGLSLPISCLFSMGAGLAPTFGAVLATRFFAAVSASPAVATGWFMIRDIWDVEKMKLPTMLYVLTVVGSPCLGIVIGSFAVSYGGWSWTMWTTLIISAITYMLSYFLYETHKPRILYIRERYLHRLDPSAAPASPDLPPPSADARMPGAIVDISRSASRRLRRPRASSVKRENRILHLQNGVKLTITQAAKIQVFEPVVICASIYMGLIFACLFQMLVSVPLVFTKVYFLATIESGLSITGLYGGIFLSFMVGAVLELTIHKHKQKRVMKGLGGRVAPEEKMGLVLVSSILFPISMFSWAWTAQPHIHWFLPLLAGAAVGFAGFSIILGLTVYLQEIYPQETHTSVISATSVTQHLLGAIFPLFVIPMYENLDVGWAGSVMALLSLMFVPAPWVLWKWGRDLRANSRFKTNAFCEKERREVGIYV